MKRYFFLLFLLFPACDGYRAENEVWQKCYKKEFDDFRSCFGSCNSKSCLDSCNGKDNSKDCVEECMEDCVEECEEDHERKMAKCCEDSYGPSYPCDQAMSDSHISPVYID